MKSSDLRPRAVRANLALICALLIAVPCLLQGQRGVTTRPKTLIFVVESSEGASFEFSVSGPGVDSVSVAKVLRDGEVQPGFQTRVQFDRASGSLNVSIATRMRPAGGSYTVELGTPRTPSMYSLPLSVRAPAGAPDARGAPRSSSGRAPEPGRADGSDIAVNPNRPLNPTPNRGTSGYPDPGEQSRVGERSSPPPTRGLPSDRPVRGGRPVVTPPPDAPEDTGREGAPVGRVEKPAEGRGVKGPAGTAVVRTFSPESRGPSGGTIVLEGTNMTSLPMVYVGETRLEKLYNAPEMVVCAFPKVEQAITGELALDGLTPGGPNRVVLATDYKVQPPAELPIAAELVHVWDNSQNSDNQAYALRRYQVRFRNVPGQDLPTRLQVKDMTARYPNYFSSAYMKKGDATKFFGSEYTVGFQGKSFRPLTVMEVSTIGAATARVELPAPDATQDYEVTNTTDLDGDFQWIQVDSFGVTQGKSEMPMGRSVAVGKLDMEGDTAFRIASGPLGTSVTWQAAPLSMNDGWFVKEMRWSVSQTKPPGEPAKAYVHEHGKPSFNWLPSVGAFELPGYPDQFLYADRNGVWPVPGAEEPNGKLMMRFDESLKALDGRIIQDTGKNPFHWYLRPIQIRLVADVTLLNDHDVTIRLDKVVFRGPSGKRWRDAIQGTMKNKEISFIVSEDRQGGTLNVFQPRE